MYNLKKHKKFGLLILGFFLTNISYSQEIYTPGYVINNSHDTLYGYIYHTNLKRSPEEIRFKTIINSEPVTYKPDEISEFRTKNEFFVSGDVIRETTNETKVDKIFLQILFNGKKNLYSYTDSEGKSSYYIKDRKGFELLINGKSFQSHNHKQDGVAKKNYTEQLSLYLNECSSKRLHLRSTQYNKESLLNLFQYYNKFSPSYVFYQKQNEIRGEFGALIGASLTTLTFKHDGKDDEYEHLVHSEFTKSVRPSAGLFCDIILPWDQGKWSIYNELLLSNYNSKSDKYTYYGNSPDIYNIVNTEFGYTYLKINNLIRYKYPVGRLFVFLNGGISTGWAVTVTNKRKVESHLGTEWQIYNGHGLYESRIKEHGFILGTGIKYKKLTLELRGEQGDGMEIYVNLTSITRRYFILLGYTF
jgi:hypothetical protein